jgi:hypothetical protein
MGSVFPHASSMPTKSASDPWMARMTLSKSTSSPPYSTLKVMTLITAGSASRSVGWVREVNAAERSATQKKAIIPRAPGLHHGRQDRSTIG